jgi:hypothetical protein
LVLLLHLLLLFAMLHAVLRPAMVRRQREITLTLPVLTQREPQAETAPAPNAAPSPRAITIPPPLFVPPPNAAPLATPDVKGLGHNLFGCAPETLADLPPELRARCPGTGIVPGDRLAVTEPRSHVKNPELRAAVLVKKNTPMTVPCVSIQTRALGNAYQDHILMVDPICTAKELRQ